MTSNSSICAALLAVCSGLAPLAAGDEYVGPFRWARKLLDADPALAVPADRAADGTVESAYVLSGQGSSSTIRLTQWQGATQAGGRNWSANTLVGDPGHTYAVGLSRWTNTEAINTGAGWIRVSRLQQDARVVISYSGSNRVPGAVVHGVTTGDGPFPAPTIAVVFAFRRLQGTGDSVWQNGWYSGNPIQVGVWQVAAGQTLAQAEANQANRLSSLSLLTEITPDSRFLAELKVKAGGQWQVSFDLDADGQVDSDLTSGVGDSKPYTVPDIDQSGGLWITAAPASGAATGIVASTTIDLGIQETDGSWSVPGRDRRPLRLSRNHASRVSPALIQGGAWTADRTVTVTPNVGLDRFTNGIFLAKIPLNAATQGGDALATQSGVPNTQVPLRVQWVTTSIVAGGSYTIKKGDSLLLVGDDGYADGRTLLVDPYGNGQDLRTGLDDARHVAVYNQVGTFTAKVYNDLNSDGLPTPNELIGSITINVVDFALPAYIPDQVNFARQLLLDTGNVPAGQVGLAQATGNLVTVGTLEAFGNSIKTTVAAGANNAPVLEARLADGTLLGAREIASFFFSELTGSGMPAIVQYPNGSVLTRGRLLLEPLRADLSVLVKIFVSGAAFPDGGLSQVINTNDFIKDAAGNGIGVFNLFVSASTASPCHNFSIYYGSTAVGR